jgi:hypothetical protein
MMMMLLELLNAPGHQGVGPAPRACLRHKLPALTHSPLPTRGLAPPPFPPARLLSAGPPRGPFVRPPFSHLPRRLLTTAKARILPLAPLLFRSVAWVWAGVGAPLRSLWPGPVPRRAPPPLSPPVYLRHPPPSPHRGFLFPWSPPLLPHRSRRLLRVTRPPAPLPPWHSVPPASSPPVHGAPCAFPPVAAPYLGPGWWWLVSRLLCARPPPPPRWPSFALPCVLVPTPPGVGPPPSARLPPFPRRASGPPPSGHSFPGTTLPPRVGRAPSSAPSALLGVPPPLTHPPPVPSPPLYLRNRRLACWPGPKQATPRPDPGAK